MSERTFDGNPRHPVLIAMQGVATLLATALGWSQYSAKRASDADAKVRKLIEAFNTAEAKVANQRAFEPLLQEAQSIREQYHPSATSRLAWYYVAMCEERLGRIDRAVRNLEELIRDNDPMMKPLAQLALATLYTNRGDRRRAMDVYKGVDKNVVNSKHGSHPPGHR